MRGRKWLALGLVLCLALGLLAACGGPKETLEELLALGNRYLAEENYQEAAVAFEKAIKLDPKCVDAYLGLADACEGSGDLEQAAKWLRQGLEQTGDERLRQRLETLEERLQEAGSETDRAGTEREKNGESSPLEKVTAVTESQLLSAIDEHSVLGKTYGELKAQYGSRVTYGGFGDEVMGVTFAIQGDILGFGVSRRPDGLWEPVRSEAELSDSSICIWQRSLVNQSWTELKEKDGLQVDVEQLKEFQLLSYQGGTVCALHKDTADGGWIEINCDDQGRIRSWATIMTISSPVSRMEEEWKE